MRRNMQFLSWISVHVEKSGKNEVWRQIGSVSYTPAPVFSGLIETKIDVAKDTIPISFVSLLMISKIPRQVHEISLKKAWPASVVTRFFSCISTVTSDIENGEVYICSCGHVGHFRRISANTGRRPQPPFLLYDILWHIRIYVRFSRGSAYYSEHQIRHVAIVTFFFNQLQVHVRNVVILFCTLCR